ncbi:heme exporter protein CcmB [Sphingomonas sp.]|uniref:heme exporter protein CcmB n=1 Tax=Sphingomonas sp. TaxID=28214 RepID=UPI0017F5EAE9|nr:heme exporter protein CcmB [Sphingomonas sp.]MBA3511226.1 heme exporter protein CcmB [Sphingomonas sp.]
MTALIARDVRRALGGAAWLPLAFFLLVATLVPFAVGPDAQLLERIGGGALWIAALTAALLPIERLVEPDRAEGVLDQLALHGLTEESVAVAKIVAHWLTFAPLLLLAAVPGSTLLGLGSEGLKMTLLALAVGTPGLAGLAVAVAALTAGLPRAGALAGILLLPLAVPLLIFGAAASGAGESGGGSGALLLEAAVSLLLCAGAPFVAGAAIRAGRT